MLAMVAMIMIKIKMSLPYKGERLIERATEVDSSILTWLNLQYFHQAAECPGVLAPGRSRRWPSGRVAAFAEAPYWLFRECLGVMCDDADHHSYESFMDAWVLFGRWLVLT